MLYGCSLVPRFPSCGQTCSIPEELLEGILLHILLTYQIKNHIFTHDSPGELYGLSDLREALLYLTLKLYQYL